jgi:hypothetical protein
MPYTDCEVPSSAAYDHILLFLVVNGGHDDAFLALEMM